MTAQSFRFSPLHQRVQLFGELYDLPENWLVANPYLFAADLVDLTPEQDLDIKECIYAIERITQLPAYQQHITGYAPIVALQPRTHGVLMGYDFHLTDSGPKLIEINTNAGGAGLVALLQLAHAANGDGDEGAARAWQQQMLAMFRNEWRLQRGDQPLRRIAIVDDDPEQQYFYPEFILFQTLLRQHGITTIIADSTTLRAQHGRLYSDDQPIDLIYNRLTDFYLTAPQHQVLRDAYQQDTVVITPHPYAYARYADKRNLACFTDESRLRDWGADEALIALLRRSIPTTCIVDATQRETLWATRKQLFFKPFSSYGSKGAFQGKKITRGVFNQLLTDNYIAQEYIPPSQHLAGSSNQTLKMDLRYYVYNGQVLIRAARLYHGQTTNFRTLGGGFAAVRLLP